MTMLHKCPRMLALTAVLVAAAVLANAAPSTDQQQNDHHQVRRARLYIADI